LTFFARALILIDFKKQIKMAKLPKTDQRKKSTKLIDKLCAINLMKAKRNRKTNNPNYSKVKCLIGVDRKTLASWWQKREEIEKQTHKRGRSNIKSPKFRGKYPEMQDILDAWAKGLRDAGCCVSGFTLKVKALQILREDLNVKVQFTASDGWLRGFLFRKNYAPTYLGIIFNCMIQHDNLKANNN